MGNATLVRTIGTEADLRVSQGADAARLAELVSALSDCPIRQALDLVQQEPIADPLATVARTLCAVLPPKRR